MKRVGLRYFLLPVFFLLMIIVFAAVLHARWNRICKNCNIVYISLDTLRGDALPCNGYNRNTAPNLCKFAAENILFRNSYSNSNHTLTSEFSVFTSLYPSVHGISEVFKYSLNPQITTLPQVLKNSGYETIFVGPLNDQSLPLNRGIERGFKEIIDSSGDSMGKWKLGLSRLLENQYRNKPTFLFLYSSDAHSPYTINELGTVSSKPIFSDDYFPQIPLAAEQYYSYNQRFLNYVLDNLKSRIAAGGSDESISANRKLYSQVISAKTFEERQKLFSTSPVLTGLREDWYALSVDTNDPKQVAYFRALYDQGIFNLDAALAPIFDFLRSNGLMNNTIVVITSEHGEEFMEHGNLFHGINLYNPSVSVPLIMAVPGVKAKKISKMAQGIDIYPTLLGLLGIKPPPWLQGTNLRKLIFGIPFAPINNFIVSEGYRFRSSSIRDERWELQQFKDGDVELYDIRKDPDEKNNLADKRPDVVSKLGNQMAKILAKKPNFPAIDIDLPKWIDETLRDKLKNTGYF